MNALKTASFEIEFQSHVFPNGLTAIVHRDTSVPLVHVNLWYRVGSGNESYRKSGFAHLFEHLMFSGSRHVGNGRYHEIMRQLGASMVNASTSADRTNYYQTVPANYLETALWMESDRMGFGLDGITQHNLDIQREVIRNERRQRYENRPYNAELSAYHQVLYPRRHPYRYRTIGRDADLEAATLSDAQSFFKKWYRPSNATITVGGQCDTDATLKLIEKWFGSLPSLPRPIPRVIAFPSLPDSYPRTVKDAFAMLKRIRFCWHTPRIFTDEDIDLTILSVILGATGWGRLYRRLVLDEHLVRSITISQTRRLHSGVFNIVATLQPNIEVRIVEGAITEELDSIHHHSIEDDEILRAVRGLEASLIWGLEDLHQRCERLQFLNHYTHNPRYLATLLHRYRERAPALIRGTIQKYLGPERGEIITLPGNCQGVPADYLEDVE